MGRSTAVTVASAVAILLSATGCGGGGGGATAEARVARDLSAVAGSGAQAARQSDPGDFAADLLRAKNFRSLWIEVDYPAGRAPEAGALDLLVRRLSERCDKPEGVHLVLDDAIPAGEFAPVLSGGDLGELEDAHRDTYSDLEAGVLAVYVLCVPGAHGEDEGDPTSHDDEGVVNGLAYRGSSLALFLDATDRGSDPWVTTAEVQGTVLVHEAGHLLGLVNGGVPMVADHEDAEHPHHDVDSESVMRWDVAVPRFAPNLGDDDFAQFGLDCIADLQAFGGR